MSWSDNPQGKPQGAAPLREYPGGGMNSTKKSFKDALNDHAVLIATYGADMLYPDERSNLSNIQTVNVQVDMHLSKHMTLPAQLAYLRRCQSRGVRAGLVWHRSGLYESQVFQTSLAAHFRRSKPWT